MENKTGRVDRAAICLTEWIERANRQAGPTWDQWAKDTIDALKAHKQDRDLALGFVHVAQMRLIDHNLEAVAAKLNELERLLQ